MLNRTPHNICLIFCGAPEDVRTDTARRLAEAFGCSMVEGEWAGDPLKLRPGTTVVTTRSAEWVRERRERKFFAEKAPAATVWVFDFREALGVVSSADRGECYAFPA